MGLVCIGIGGEGWPVGFQEDFPGDCPRLREEGIGRAVLVEAPEEEAVALLGVLMPDPVDGEELGIFCHCGTDGLELLSVEMVELRERVDAGLAPPSIAAHRGPGFGGEALGRGNVGFRAFEWSRIGIGGTKAFSLTDPRLLPGVSEEMTVVFEDPETPDHPPEERADAVPLEENVVEEEVRKC